MADPGLNLRELVADVVRESVADLVKASLAEPIHAGASDGTAPAVPDPPVAVPGEEGRVCHEGVRIASDADLDQFVRRLLALFENPKKRQDLRAGRLRFHLTGRPGAGGSGTAARRVDRGAVTERVVADAARRSESLLLARSAVLTPLAREKARALGVHIEKEH